MVMDFDLEVQNEAWSELFPVALSRDAKIDLLTPSLTFKVH